MPLATHRLLNLSLHGNDISPSVVRFWLWRRGRTKVRGRNRFNRLGVIAPPELGARLERCLRTALGEGAGEARSAGTPAWGRRQRLGHDAPRAAPNYRSKTSVDNISPRPTWRTYRTAKQLTRRRHSKPRPTRTAVPPFFEIWPGLVASAAPETLAAAQAYSAVLLQYGGGANQVSL